MAAEAADKKDDKEVKEQPKAAAKDAAAPAAPVGEKKLSGAELKKRAKEEKAARRAQAKVTQAPPPQGSAGQQADGKGGKGKTKQDLLHQAQGLQHQHGKQPSKPVPAAVVKEKGPAVPECFSHLSMARRIEMTQADKDVDPAILVLGQHMSTFAISDSITRLEATLYAFKKVRHPARALMDTH